MQLPMSFSFPEHLIQEAIQVFHEEGYPPMSHSEAERALEGFGRLFLAFTGSKSLVAAISGASDQWRLDSTSQLEIDIT